MKEIKEVLEYVKKEEKRFLQQRANATSNDALLVLAGTLEALNQVRQFIEGLIGSTSKE